jgi:hypothetical protein
LKSIEQNAVTAGGSITTRKLWQGLLHHHPRSAQKLLGQHCISLSSTRSEYYFASSAYLISAEMGVVLMICKTLSTHQFWHIK